jgi:translocation and assembly module TamB
VVGHKLDESSSKELLANAATSLGLKSGNQIARQLGSKAGLDEARFGTEGDIESMSFLAGKYLTPKLFVSHGIGLFDRISTFRARYRLSSKWTLQAETGRGTGTDVLYRVERDR